jgi:uncharacterized protein (DUF427 family)
MKPNREPPGPGQESVWDYPRPPRCERVDERITITLDGEVIVDAPHAFRVLETSHPPTYYIPTGFVRPGVLVPATGSSVCEWKGRAAYFDVVGRTGLRERVAWGYPDATGAFAPIADCVAFYAGPMDRCTVGDETVTPQPGGFYGGWITSKVVGPFKGVPGTMGW